MLFGPVPPRAGGAKDPELEPRVATTQSAAADLGICNRARVPLLIAERLAHPASPSGGNPGQRAIPVVDIRKSFCQVKKIALSDIKCTLLTRSSLARWPHSL